MCFNNTWRSNICLFLIWGHIVTFILLNKVSWFFWFEISYLFSWLVFLLSCFNSSLCIFIRFFHYIFPSYETFLNCFSTFFTKYLLIICGLLFFFNKLLLFCLNIWFWLLLLYPLSFNIFEWFCNLILVLHSILKFLVLAH